MGIAFSRAVGFLFVYPRFHSPYEKLTVFFSFVLCTSARQYQALVPPINYPLPKFSTKESPRSGNLPMRGDFLSFLLALTLPQSFKISWTYSYALSSSRGTRKVSLLYLMTFRTDLYVRFSSSVTPAMHTAIMAIA